MGDLPGPLPFTPPPVPFSPAMPYAPPSPGAGGAGAAWTFDPAQIDAIMRNAAAAQALANAAASAPVSVVRAAPVYSSAAPLISTTPAAFVSVTPIAPSALVKGAPAPAPPPPGPFANDPGAAAAYAAGQQAEFVKAAYAQLAADAAAKGPAPDPGADFYDMGSKYYFPSKDGGPGTYAKSATPNGLTPLTTPKETSPALLLAGSLAIAVVVGGLFFVLRGK